MSLRPNVALLLGTARTCAPAATLSATKSSKAISQQIAIPSRTPAASTAPAPVPGTKFPARSAYSDSSRKNGRHGRYSPKGWTRRLSVRSTTPTPGAQTSTEFVAGVLRAGQHRAQHDRHADGAGGPVDRRGGVGVAQRVDVRGVLRPQHHVRARAATGGDVRGELLGDRARGCRAPPGAAR
jgi:hypothetical protein